MSSKGLAWKITAVVGCLLLSAGAVYVLVGPVGQDHGWSEHDYAAWGLVASGVAFLLFVALPALLVERRRRPA
ncbi:hypothetical protein [Egicoccus sp. AB-alg6-2]|uniref:hypothetical protein n=1 Tax=Egicoccus sp. AB-alg6-2 TaxID=3242692 RepID=UPI00359DF197